LPYPVTHILRSTLCILFFLSACGSQPTSIPSPVLPNETPTASLTPIQPPTQTPYVITATLETPTSTPPAPQDIFILSLADAGRSHLFAYSPQTLPFTRLTSGEWDDITPALSPDGKRVAFASNRSGYWDLYTLDLQTGETVRLTDTPEYDGAPSWSLPDGAFIAYESYADGNLDIFIRSVTDPAQDLTRLTQDPATDSSPAWSPQGRQIAFVSNRSGEPEIWVANLDSAGEAINLSGDSKNAIAHPAWSPDGSKLAWAATDPDSGLTGLYVWDTGHPGEPARWAGSGDWPVWQDATHLVTRLTAPNQTFLAGYSSNGVISLPPVQLPGPLNGLTITFTAIAWPGPFETVAQDTLGSLYNSSPGSQSGNLSERASLVPLAGVQAASPQLHELAVDSFQALRHQVASRTGWDALASLENAYVPLTTPLEPGMGEDWLYTGRAFTLNPALINEGWMAVVREDFGQQTYWRIYLRINAQDGSQGAPLAQIPWDFSARIGNPGAYENGGRLMDSAPSGYWLDLAALAVQYGWERLPALTDWRTYYAGAYFNELAFTQGLDWRTAMLQLYPPEILVTPTVVLPPTRTPTRTPLWYRSPTSTP
ncbi:MAG: LpqB family beta-propeller domain-containing protein, partial [Chloroflexota bacterium]